MNDNNKNLIEKYLNGKKKYNVINCQFSFHYYLSNSISWDNFCKNLKSVADNNAYLLITTFDGDLIRKKLENKSKYTISYTDNSGKNNIFAEISKFYSDKDKNDIGMAIDVYNSLISENGVTNKEFLVFPDLLISDMSSKCDMELVETDTFVNLFDYYRNFFLGDALEGKNRRKHENIQKFYKKNTRSLNNKFSEEEIEIAKASLEFSSLNRYYVFKKRAVVDLEPSRIVGIAGELHLPEELSNKIKIDLDLKNNDINKIYSHFRKLNAGISLNVWIIRHEILKEKQNEFDNKTRLDFIQKKKGDKGNIILYKSPENIFYPVYFIEGVQQAHSSDIPSGINMNGKKKYIIFEKDKIEELDRIIKNYQSY
ncbi:MAG: hypothetical protein H0X03_08585 [Nitrosopumilus sp.]|nr:hypothetical protein [Nitrosopumilus sp.]